MQDIVFKLVPGLYESEFLWCFETMSVYFSLFDWYIFVEKCAVFATALDQSRLQVLQTQPLYYQVCHINLNNIIEHCASNKMFPRVISYSQTLTDLQNSFTA